MRISGFISGLDIDAMVKELMSAHRKPLTKLQQQKTLLEWKREDYRKISTRMADFRYNKLPTLSSSNVLNAKKAQVTGDSSLVSARVVDPSQAQGSMTIKVLALATSASTYSQTGLVQPGGISSDDLRTMSLQELGIDAGSEVVINGELIEIHSSDTIQNLVDKINQSKAGVTAFFDYESGKLSITNKKTGAGTVDIDEELYENFINAFDLKAVSGQDAKVQINGMEITRDTNKFTINGIELTLNADSLTSTATITPVTDTDAIVNSIKSFINSYNELIALINGELNEERFRNYAPLTDEQREKMTEKQIELWEDKARSGMLRNDSILSKVINDLRIALISDVTTSKGEMNITHLGITTGSWSTRGQLVIQDEEKLRAAIEENPEAVLELFSAAGDYTSPEGANTGIFNRVRAILTEGLDMLAEKAGTSRIGTSESEPFLKNSLMESELSYLERRITDMERKLLDLENRYYKQFTAMETAMSRYNQQAGSIAGFFMN